MVTVETEGRGVRFIVMASCRGWKWSEHVKPIAKTDSCQAAHYAKR